MSVAATTMASPTTSQVVPRERRHPVLTRFLRHRLAVSGVVVIAVMIAVAIAAPVLAPYDPIGLGDVQLAPPSRQHWLGTDDFGRDVLSRLIYGSRISLEVALISVSIALVAGTVIGVVSAYFGGWLDTALSRTNDVIFSFPDILLAIGLMAMLGPSLRNVMIALGIIYTPIFARVCRASTLVVLTHQYLDAARVTGVPHRMILWRHVLPNILAPLIVQTSVTFAFAILTEAALSFIGLGAQPPTPSWGLMLNAARQLVYTNAWLSVYPGVAIMLAVLSFNFIGDGLQDALDPRAQRH
ncbi:MAG TPA: ABC transporter permease [Thermomicrobiales bacterium]